MATVNTTKTTCRCSSCECQSSGFQWTHGGSGELLYVLGRESVCATLCNIASKIGVKCPHTVPHGMRARAIIAICAVAAHGVCSDPTCSTETCGKLVHTSLSVLEEQAAHNIVSRYRIADTCPVFEDDKTPCSGLIMFDNCRHLRC